MQAIKIKHIFILFVLIALVQLFIPIQMILGQETILDSGTAYKFRTEPIDPTDPFRGKYITLRYNINSAITPDTTWLRQDDVYVYIKKDSLGFAQLTQVSKKPLPVKEDYVIAKASWYNYNTNTLRFNLPFNRFYMEENKAKPAEEAHREAQRDTIPNNTYALVYVKEGDAVLKNVIINKVPIADYVE
ncbi:GDYXXLXY domain-containing protein [Pontimicrobium sp. MEBiC01747]